jgi:hypothetical protein
MLGEGSVIEEKMIAAATKFVMSTIGHYPLGSRRFAAKMFNIMREAALRELAEKQEE